MNGTMRLCPARIHATRGPAASAAKRLLQATALIALVAGAGCVARPTGDFGRAAPSWTHDEAMPTVGKWRAGLNKEPVSRFNLTDQEEEMHNRVWRFLVAAHADWFHDAATELQRTRLTGPLDHRFGISRYYDWLKNTRYRSSRVRYATVGDDIEKDLATIPGTFLAICAVIEVDRNRAISEGAFHAGDAAIGQDVAARKIENDTYIDWFVRALRYRYESYSYALEQLLVETPHEEARIADAWLGGLEHFVLRAESGDFCAEGTTWAQGSGEGAIPGRILMNRDREMVEQK